MRVVVAPLRSFPPGERRIVEVGGRSIGLFRVGARLSLRPDVPEVVNSPIHVSRGLHVYAPNGGC